MNTGCLVCLSEATAPVVVVKLFFEVGTKKIYHYPAAKQTAQHIYCKTINTF